MGLFSGLNTKAILGAFGAAGTALIAAQADGVITGNEVGLVIGALLAGLGFTYFVPFAKYFKAITATAVSVAAALAVALENGGGIDTAERYAILAIIATAVATFSAPNASASTPTA